MIPALAVPWLFPGLESLFVSAALLGGAYVFYHVSIQSMVGALSTEATRARNFANFSLIATVPYFIGPLLTGWLIERGGHASAYLALAILPVVAGAVLIGAGGAMPRPRAPAGKATAHVKGHLLHNKPLVNMAVTS